MELENLIRERDAYAGKIVRMAIYIALIFIIPAGCALALYFLFAIPVVYTLPVSFILSWMWVYALYTKVSRHVKALDRRIQELQAQTSHGHISQKDS